MIEIRQRVSVRTLVEFVLRQGDLLTGVTGGSRLVEGIRAHQFLQKNRGADYQSEVTLRTAYIEEDFVLEIHGRADGILKSESGITIEEIKSTSMDLELINESFSNLHWAQAQCYAYLLAKQESLAQVGVQLTYVQLDTHETTMFTRMYQYEVLEGFFLSLVERYLNWARRLYNWSKLRNISIQNLEFPYPKYRLGQRELVVAVYKTIKEGKRLFVQAPTGIGKTLGTIFPAVKALGEGLCTPIFYLTAKTITRTVAENSFAALQTQGLALKRLTLTAKDKICLCPDNPCTPEECRYAKGYYDRVGTAVEEIFKEDSWNREHLEYFARKYEVCPFEFSLDLSNWADFIICDYNYVFDPRVYLKRFFLDSGEYTFLIDEAHNLVDRAREMFSAELKKEEFLELRRELQAEEPILSKRLQTVNSNLGKLKKRNLEVQIDPPISLYSSLEKFLKETDKYLQKEESPSWKEKLTELYFKVLGFLRTAENYDERYVTYYRSNEQEFVIKLYCVDPSKRLTEGLERGRAAVLFSATLSPIEYFMQILGGEVSSYKLKLGSPFPSENLCIMIHNRISTKFSQRAVTLSQVVKAIAAFVQSKMGNYLVYLPSYDYLQDVIERFGSLYPEIQLISQTLGMTEADRESFLETFEPNPNMTLVGFALMGGIFGEGVDLTGERLSGAVIVGVGLPQIGSERDIIRSHFEVRYQMGFEFAYMYPGMNKVLQAVGRVIRTEKDQGAVLLIDERFSFPSYRKLYPKEWKPIQYVNNTEQITAILQKFWSPNE